MCKRGLKKHLINKRTQFKKDSTENKNTPEDDEEKITV